MYLSQENDIEETFARVFSYVDGVNEKGKILPEDEIYELLKDYKLVEGKWTILMRYRPKNSINTMDIDNMISEIEAEGELEVKMVVHDYIKRLRPNYPVGDLRIDLGECVNDLSILAKKRKIPVVSGNQLNREAYRMLNETTASNGKTVSKLDQGKKLDASMISESQLVLENADSAFAINRELAADGQMYLTFTEFKDRASRTLKKAIDSYFVHPFESDNGMKLVEDALSDYSASLDSIESKFGSSTIEDNFEDEEDVPQVVKKKTVKQLSSVML